MPLWCRCIMSRCVCVCVCHTNIERKKLEQMAFWMLRTFFIHPVLSLSLCLFSINLVLFVCSFFQLRNHFQSHKIRITSLVANQFIFFFLCFLFLYILLSLCVFFHMIWIVFLNTLGIPVFSPPFTSIFIPDFDLVFYSFISLNAFFIWMWMFFIFVFIFCLASHTFQCTLYTVNQPNQKRRFWPFFPEPIKKAH